MSAFVHDFVGATARQGGFMCFGIREKIDEAKKKVERVIVISKTVAITYAVMFVLVFAMNIWLLVMAYQIQGMLK